MESVSKASEVVQFEDPALRFEGHEACVLGCAASQDGKFAISASKDKTARIWDLSEGTCRAILKGHTDAVRNCSLSADGKIAATASDDGSARIWDVSERSPTILYEVHRSSLPKSCNCQLTPDGQFLVATFYNETNRKGQAVLLNWRNSTIVRAWTRNDHILDCALSENARTISFWSSSSSVECFDVGSGEILLQCKSHGSVSIDLDAAGDRIVIADHESLRTCTVRNRALLECLPNYKSENIPQIHCAISADGEHIVASMNNHMFGVWNSISCTMIAILNGHADISAGCAISDRGSIIVTCSRNREVCVWKDTILMSSKNVSKPYPILMQFQDALDEAYGTKNSKFLRARTLRNVLVRSNVRSVCDLMAGHNLLLLAVREGLLKPENMGRSDHCFSHLAEQLYCSVPEESLSDSDLIIVKQVLWHAERVGFVGSDIAPTLKDEKSCSDGSYKKNLGSIFTTLAGGVCMQDNSSLYKQAQVRRNYFQDSLQFWNISRKDVLRHVRELCYSLSELHGLIQNQKMKGLFCGISRCMVLLLRIFFNDLENGGFETTFDFANSKKGFADRGISQPNFIFNQIVGIDLSNFQLLRYFFSDMFLMKLDQRLCEAVVVAVQVSAFESLKNLRRAFARQIKKNAKSEPEISQIDHGRDERQACPVENLPTREYGSYISLPAENRSIAEESMTEESAKRYFHSELARGSSAISYSRANAGIRGMFLRSEYCFELDSNEVMNALFEADVEERNVVDEKCFLVAFKLLLSAMESRQQELSEEWEKTFIDAAGGASAKIINFLAARMIRQSAKREGFDLDEAAIKQEMECRNVESNMVGLQLYLEVARDFLKSGN